MSYEHPKQQRLADEYAGDAVEYTQALRNAHPALGAENNAQEPREELTERDWQQHPAGADLSLINTFDDQGKTPRKETRSKYRQVRDQIDSFEDLNEMAALGGFTDRLEDERKNGASGPQR